MPELPEVQTIVDGLVSAGVPGCSIIGVETRWPRTLATHGPEDFEKRITGQTISAIGRRGKYIVFDLPAPLRLIVHLRMTGHFRLDSPASPSAPHDRVALRLSDGRTLCFHDLRKFGRFYLTAEPESVLGRLGVEPLEPDFTAALLGELLLTRKRQIKPMLLDQAVIAGLGNIYVDEALWDARIHPLRGSSTLTSGEVARLCESIRRVLVRGVRNSGTSLGEGLGNYATVSMERGGNAARLEVYRRVGQPCSRCGTPIIRTVIGQRGTHLCPSCQQA